MMTGQGDSTRGSIGRLRVRDEQVSAAGALTPEIEVRNFNFFYGSFQALNSIAMTIPERRITALIGASGCGKSTLLRAMNRMHDNTVGAYGKGELLFDGDNILDLKDLVDLRKKIGMIFQRSTAFPMSIFDNVAYGLRLESQKLGQTMIKERVERALHGAALWDEVKDKLDKSGLALSGGQQQRLCIARAVAVEPKVLLMDEPCAALDPISTLKVEELMYKLKDEVTIVIVTHNMQQAARVADYTAFMNMIPETRAGQLIEFGATNQIFTNPRDPRTEAYISGKFG